MLLLNRSDTSNLKKILPKGTCLVNQLKKYQYIHKFVSDPLAYKFILPMQAQFSSFVVIRNESENNPIFQMYYHPLRKFLLSAQQQSISIGCNYVISKSLTPSKGENFIGKLRGNFQADQFQLYDNGDNPERVKTRPRKHLAYIKKQQQSIFSNNQKEAKITMVVPKPEESSEFIGKVSQYEPSCFVCSDKTSNPLAKESLTKDVNTETMRLKEGDPSIRYLRTMTLFSSINTEGLVIRQKSKTYFEMEIGCPLTILQGMGYLLAAVEALSL